MRYLNRVLTCLCAIAIFGSTSLVTAQTCDTPQVLFLADHSGSMDQQFDAGGSPTTRWFKATIGMVNLLNFAPTADAPLNFGLLGFPGGTGCITDSEPHVQPDALNKQPISEALVGFEANGAASLWTALNAAHQFYVASDASPTRRRYVMLVSDGNFECGSSNGALQSKLEQMKADGIYTFVLRIGIGSAANEQLLDFVAYHGGMGKTGCTSASSSCSYNLVGDLTKLQQALRKLGQPSPEICDDGLDNDCDGQSDATDSDCQTPEPPVAPEEPKNDVDEPGQNDEPDVQNPEVQTPEPKDESDTTNIGEPKTDVVTPENPPKTDKPITGPETDSTVHSGGGCQVDPSSPTWPAGMLFMFALSAALLISRRRRALSH